MRRRRVATALRAIALVALHVGDVEALAGFLAVALPIFQTGMKYFKFGRMGLMGSKTAYKEYNSAFSKPRPFRVYEARLVQVNATCSRERRDLGEQISPTQCGYQVRLAEGFFFDFGKGTEHSMKCFADFADREECPEGLTPTSDYDFYALDRFEVFPQLVKVRRECKAKDKRIGTFSTIQLCAKAVQEYGGKFFSFGTHVPMAGQCRMKYTKNRFCPEGFKTALADFYAMRYSKETPADDLVASEARLVAENQACNSADEYVGWFVTLAACASAIKEKGEKFFIYGKRFNRWLCYIEKTASVDCPEGFHKDNYNFYELTDNSPVDPLPPTAESDLQDVSV